MHETARTLHPTATVRGIDISMFVALELSRSTWLVAVNAPHIDKISKYRVEAGDGAALLGLLSRLRAEAERRSGRSVKTISIQETGLEDFRVHRLLRLSCCWFRHRGGDQRGKIQHITIVALARKLLVAPWRYVTQGVVPSGAEMKA